jgi:hypothetical protein
MLSTSEQEWILGGAVRSVFESAHPKVPRFHYGAAIDPAATEMPIIKQASNSPTGSPADR